MKLFSYRYLFAFIVFLSLHPSSVLAAQFMVHAKTNSLDGVAMNTGVVVQCGQELVISADASDTWYVGGGEQYLTDADGFVGASFPFQGASLPLGSLVGSLDGGQTFFEIGTQLTKPVDTDIGVLELYHWDNGNQDNSGDIEVTVTVNDAQLSGLNCTTPTLINDTEKFMVNAHTHSVIGGTALDTGVSAQCGQQLLISTGFTDTWNVGSLVQHISNANGLGNPWGQLGPLFSHQGASALYGSLMGSLDGGQTFFHVGTGVVMPVTADNSTLQLYHWDSTNYDSSGDIEVSVTVYEIDESQLPESCPDPVTALEDGSFTSLQDVTPNTTYTSNPIWVTAAEDGATASVNNGATLIKNGQAVGNSTTVAEGDSIAIVGTSPYSGSVQFSLTLGQQQLAWSLESAPIATPVVAAGDMSGYTPVNCDVSDSGAATCSIPITAPAGTGGVAPSLSLNYSSQGSNGPLGLGWSLGGLAGITRCAATQAQDGLIDGVDFDANDRFCLNGERLMAVNGAYGADSTVYFTEQHSFQKIVSYGAVGDGNDNDKGPERFTVQNKAGLTMEFGGTADARIEAQGRTDVLVWALNKVRDTKGNYFTVRYTENDGEYFPHRLDYTGNAAAGLATYASVNFVYEARPDVSTAYISGSVVKSTKRLVQIETLEGADIFRKYTLNYEQAGAAQRSRLVSVQECGTDNTCFAPTHFSWQSSEGTPYFADPQMWLAAGSANNSHPYSGSGQHESYVDLNGDGLADRVWVPNGRNDLWVALSNGSGFDPPTIWLDAGSAGGSDPISYNGRRTGYVDLNGDGLPDKVWMPNDRLDLWVALSTGSKFQTPQMWLDFNSAGGINVYSNNGYHEGYADLNGDGLADKVWMPHRRSDVWVALSTGSGFQTPQMWLDFNSAGSINVFSGNGFYTRHLDLNGDGLADRVWVPSGRNDLWVALSTGSGFQTPTIWLAAGSANGSHPHSGSGQHEGYADVNGDGLADKVWMPSGRSDIWVALSTGSEFQTPTIWLAKNSAGGSPSHSYNGFHVSYADLNGDGLADKAWVPSGRSDLWVALSTGSGFQTPTIWLATGSAGGSNPRSYNGQYESYADVNGDGLADRVWVPNGRNDLWVSIAAAPKQNLLATVKNGHDASTTFTYEPLTNSDVYTKGNTATYPQQDFKAPLYVVSKLTTDNGIGGQHSNSYEYEGATISLDGRGFRGFSKITQTDDTTGIQQITEYERDYRYISSSIKRTESRLADGSLLSETDNIPTLTIYGNGVRFSRVSHSVSKSYELDGSLIGTTTTTNQLDNCGNHTQVKIETEDDHPNTPDKRIETTDNTYTNSSNCTNPSASTPWILGRLEDTTVSRAVNGQAPQTRASSWEYDAQTGLLTKEIIEPNEELCIEKVYQHDAYGNILQSTTQGCTTTKPQITARSQHSTFDSKGRYLLTNTNALDHSETKQYDKFGNQTALTGPNGLTTRWQYDGFGRPTLETRADGTSTQTAYRLNNSSNSSSSPCSALAHYYTQSASTGGKVSYQCFDKLDRKIRTVSFGFDGKLIFVDTEYNARGEIKRKSEPYFSTNSPVWTTISYDELSRPIKHTAPNGSFSEISYQGLTTVTTNALKQKQTTVKDVHGNLIRSTDTHLKSVIYLYDGYNNLLEMRDSKSNLTQISYDQRGNKTQLLDPDTGVTTYQYNALGQLHSQTDANNDTVTFQYDLLGRMTQRKEPEGTSTWTYDSATQGIGKLAEVKLAEANGADGYQQKHRYDSFGRLVHTQTHFDEQTFNVTTHYNQYGQVAALVYPTNFAVRHEYNIYGYLARIRRADIENDADNLLWEAKTMNARGQLEEQRFGNGLTTQKTYDALTGFVKTINTAGVQNLAYTFDALGNLTQRQKDGTLTENFSYDALNRLTQSQVVGGQSLTLSYDELGNILSKSDVGGYVYGGNGAGPHAVTKAGNTTYTYDAVGNRISSSTGQQITYSSFNKPTLIEQGSTSLSFKYGPDRARYQQTIERDGDTTQLLYLGKLYEVETKDGVSTGKHHVFAGKQTVAVYTRDTLGEESTHYLHRDHLGSVESITDEQGELDSTLSFDAWGQRRSAQWSVLSEQQKLDLIDSLDIRRGFTGHEHLDEVNLIHMNGRVYDPLLGRFLSADPVVQQPGNMQNLNRYSYVLNNPLSYTDPSGFIFKALKKFGRSIGKFFKKYGKQLAAIVVGIATAGAALAAAGLASVAGAATLNGVVISGAGFGLGSAMAGTLLNGGSFGDALKAGIKGAVIGGITARLTFGVGKFFGKGGTGAKFFGSGTGGAKIAAHGIVGGLSSVAKGGRFKHGFLAGAFTEAFSPAIDSITPNPYGRAAAAAVVGGTAAQLGGGKFANGAVTGAFVYLFNHATTQRKDLNNSGDAIEHYILGDGETMALSEAVKQKIMSHPNVTDELIWIIAGLNESPYRIDLDFGADGWFNGWDAFHLGNTKVIYDTVCSSGNCTTTFTAPIYNSSGIPDRFQDPFGYGVELPGATPYNYEVFNWSVTYPKLY